MSPSKGFTLIELMIVVAIIGVISAVVAPHFSSKGSNPPGIFEKKPVYLVEPPPTEIRCVEGMKFIVQRTNGNLTQIFSNKGDGMPCKE